MALGYSFDGGFVLGHGIGRLGREELIELCRKLCLVLMDVEGGYHGCVHPYNISLEPDGTVGLGPKSEGGGEWSTWELEFMAPELFWNGTGDATVDVYSVGLLLYAGVTGGRLPFFPRSGEITNEVRAAAVRDRMNGRAVGVPSAAGEKLGAVIASALATRPVERFSGPVELLSALSECVGYGDAVARELFGKSESQLTDSERIVAGLVGADYTPEEPAPASPLPRRSGQEPEEASEDAPEDAPGTAPEDAPDTAPEDAADNAPEVAPDAASDTAPEDASNSAAEEDGQVRTGPAAPPPEAESSAPEEPSPAKERRRLRLRPIWVILLLLLLLSAAAYLTRDYWLDYVMEGGASRAPVIDVTVPPSADVTAAPIVTPDGQPVSQPTPTAQPLPRYEVYIEDISWTDAEIKCEALGGHLVTVGDAEELQAMTALAGESGVDMVWIGFYRDIRGELSWVNDEDIVLYVWAPGEPSLSDTDGTAENYGLLWHRNGAWVYNDCRNDPAADFPQFYSGKIGYICEYEDR